MSTDKTLEKNKKMLELLSKPLFDTLESDLWEKQYQVLVGYDNSTIKIVDSVNNILYLIDVQLSGLGYNLTLNNSTLFLTLHDLFFKKADSSQSIINWFNCYLSSTNPKKIPSNQDIVEYLNWLMLFYKSNLTFELNGIHPEFFALIDSQKSSSVFQVKNNGACFVLKDIETSRTFIVNYIDFLAGDDLQKHLAAWLIDMIFEPQLVTV